MIAAPAMIANGELSQVIPAIQPTVSPESQASVGEAMPDRMNAEAGGLTSDSVLVQVSRMGERVAGVEARLEALKSDTEITRGSVHAINGELQKIVIVEERCQQSLSFLEKQVTSLVNAAPTIQSAVQTFEGMRSDLRTLVVEHGTKLNTAQWAGRILPWLIALASILAWGATHLQLKP